MTKDDKQDLLEIYEVDEFWMTVFHINKDYINSIDWMDEEILNHYLSLVGCESLEEYQQKEKDTEGEEMLW